MLLPNVSFPKARIYRKTLLLELKWMFAQIMTTESENEAQKILLKIKSARTTLRRFPVTRREIYWYHPFRSLKNIRKAMIKPAKKAEDPWLSKWFDEMESAEQIPVIDKDENLG